MVWETLIVVETTMKGTYVVASKRLYFTEGLNSAHTRASRRSLPFTVFVKVVSRTAQ